MGRFDFSLSNGAPFVGMLNYLLKSTFFTQIYLEQVSQPLLLTPSDFMLHLTTFLQCFFLASERVVYLTIKMTFVQFVILHTCQMTWPAHWLTAKYVCLNNRSKYLHKIHTSQRILANTHKTT